MEKIYTIPVNEAFEKSEADHSCGCPFCTLYRKLENDQLELILGASMMEPDVRIKTNELGFCKTHYDMMFTRKNRLGMALMRNTDAFLYFSALDTQQQKRIIEQSRQLKSRKEMKSFVDNLKAIG